MPSKPATHMSRSDFPPERRRFARIPFEAWVRIRGPDRTWTAALVDVSLKGVLIERPDDWPGSTGRRLSLELETEDGVTICMEATPIHVGEGRVGLRCERIDLDSASHLRRLVELNLGDPALLDRELAALVGD